MSEFGHFASGGGGTYFDAWGAGPFSIEVNDKSYLFEDSDRFGPALLNQNGELKKNPYPGQRSPFWRGHFAWVKQGRRLEDDGKTCIWSPLKPNYYRIIGRQRFVVEYGDADGPYIEITEK